MQTMWNNSKRYSTTTSPNWSSTSHCHTKTSPSWKHVWLADATIWTQPTTSQRMKLTSNTHGNGPIKNDSNKLDYALYSVADSTQVSAASTPLMQLSIIS